MQAQALKIILMGVGGLVLLGAILVGYIRNLKRVAPVVNNPALEVQGADADKRFAKLDGKANLWFVLLTIGFGLLAYLLFDALLAVRVMVLPPALMTYAATHAILVLAAMFAGMGVAIIVFCAFFRRRLGDDARWYIYYASIRRYGCDYERLCRGLGYGVLLLVAVLLFLGVNTYVQVRETAFVVHPLLGLREQVHSFGDITGIDTSGKFVAPNGRIRRERDYVVHFKDGSRWVASNLPSGDAYDRKRLVDALAKRAGVTIVEVAVFSTSDVYD